MAITWDPALAVGHALIDTQHQELFRRVDLLLEAARSGQTGEELSKLLAFLREYVVKHFGAEEALMQEIGYPHAAAHRAEHAVFVADLGAMVRNHEHDGATASLVVYVNGRVTRWLFEHIAVTDRRLGTFLAGRSGSHQGTP